VIYETCNACGMERIARQGGLDGGACADCVLATLRAALARETKRADNNLERIRELTGFLYDRCNMSPDAINAIGTAEELKERNFKVDEYFKVVFDERDALRAEVERLKGLNEDLDNRFRGACRDGQTNFRIAEEARAALAKQGKAQCEEIARMVEMLRERDADNGRLKVAWELKQREFDTALINAARHP
jgi:hypothetical protein